MAKGAATEVSLARVHAALASVIETQLNEKLLSNPEAVAEQDAEPEYMFTASPALLTVAARFLKDNDITADVGSGTDSTARIKAQLAQLQNKGQKVVRLSELHPVEENAG